MLTVQGAVLAYCGQKVQTHEWARSTARVSENTLLNFAAAVGPDRPVSEMTVRHVDRWLASRKVAPATLRVELSKVKTFCAWLVTRGYMRKDPTLSVRGPRQPRSVPRAIQHADVASLYAVAPDARAVVIVSLMVQEGLRCIEVAGLQVGDIDRVEGVILVHGKGGHERVLPVSGETRAAMASYLLEHPATGGPLIRSYRDGKQMTAGAISVLVARWMKEAGVKQARYDGISAHALRHTAATDMLRHGAHLRDVQAALGHVSIATTQRYLPHVVKDLREAMGGRNYRRANPSATEANHPAAS